MADSRVVKQVRGDSALQTEVLDDLSEAENYRSWLVSLAAPYVGTDLLEVGSGNGDFAAEWLALDPELRVTATEGEDVRLAALQQRFADEPRVAVEKLLLPADAGGHHSSALAFNVVEHIVDDVAALRSMGQLVRPGGFVVVFVPAFEVAMSAFDHEVGHVRRYRRDGLRTALERAGLEVDQLHYVNSLGLGAWIVGMRLLRRRPEAGATLRVWDGRVIPVLRRVENRWRPPFGQSLFAVAHRPAG